MEKSVAVFVRGLFMLLLGRGAILAVAFGTFAVDCCTFFLSSSFVVGGALMTAVLSLISTPLFLLLGKTLLLSLILAAPSLICVLELNASSFKSSCFDR